MALPLRGTPGHLLMRCYRSHFAMLRAHTASPFRNLFPKRRSAPLNTLLRLDASPAASIALTERYPYCAMTSHRASLPSRCPWFRVLFVTSRWPATAFSYIRQSKFLLSVFLEAVRRELKGATIQRIGNACHFRWWRLTRLPSSAPHPQIDQMPQLRQEPSNAGPALTEHCN
jgi:hypothetical protein